MPQEIRVPRLGWSMEEGVFLRWLKNDGELIQPGDLLYELESDKAAQEIESVDGGVLRISPDAPEPGAVVPVGALLGFLLAENEPAPWEKAPSATLSSQERSSEGATANAPATTTARTINSAPTDRPARRIATPRAKRVARELDVDWTQLHGSGRGGRVREADVRRAAGAARHSVPANASPDEGTAIPVSARRRAIAGRMMAGVQNTAPVTLTTRADAVNLVSLRRQFQTTLTGTPAPSYTDIVLCLTARVLRRHPLLAGRWEGERIVLPPEDGLHLGLAVDTEEGLLAPVLRNVAAATLVELAQRSRDLIDRARQGKLTPDELHGGVFTVTNLGAYGIDAFTPIVNYPETAILGLGAIRREAAVDGEDRLVPRERIALSLTFDHRVIDGAPAARFLKELVAAIENPAAVLLAGA